MRRKFKTRLMAMVCSVVMIFSGTSVAYAEKSVTDFESSTNGQENFNEIDDGINNDKTDDEGNLLTPTPTPSEDLKGTDPGEEDVEDDNSEGVNIPEMNEENNETTLDDASTYLNNPISAFLENLYQKCLGRTIDPTGLADWTKKLENHQVTGVGVAFGIVFSQEYINKGVDDATFIRMLYSAIFNREAGETEVNNWLSDLGEGVTRQYVFRGVINSVEFGNLCRNSGIDQGYFVSSEILDQNLHVTSFVKRTYNLCLNRDPDPVGWKDWVGKLIRNQRDGVSLVWSFIHSSEFSKKNLGDAEYIEILYQIFMNRSSDPVGKNDWSDKLANGASRDYVMAGFANSAEFGKVCKQYGISQGGMNVTEVRDKYYEITKLVNRLYKVFLQRTPSGSELNQWVSKAANKSITGTELVANFVFSQEYLNRHTSNSQYATELYTAILNRTDVAGAAHWTRQLDSGKSRTFVLESFTSSAEIVNMFKSLNISTIKEGWVYVNGLRRYQNRDGSLRNDVSDIFNPSSKYVTVDRIKGITTIYGYNSDSGNYDTPLKSMWCSVGKPISLTATGNYKIGWQLRVKEMNASDGSYRCWAPYVSQIYGLVYFHGVASNTPDLRQVSSVAFKNLGTPQSHGCVRLAACDAKWIYYNMGRGTSVKIGDNLASPLTPIRYSWNGFGVGPDPTYS